jgi:hypothetical protein
MLQNGGHKAQVFLLTVPLQHVLHMLRHVVRVQAELDRGVDCHHQGSSVEVVVADDHNFDVWDERGRGVTPSLSSSSLTTATGTGGGGSVQVVVNYIVLVSVSVLVLVFISIPSATFACTAALHTAGDGHGAGVRM